MNLKNKYYLIILMLVFMVRLNAASKDTLNSTLVEAKSYELYLQKNWTELSKFCERAFSEKYDYYYLRMRAGIACYEKKQYRKAITHFEKALNFDNTEIVKEYLYFSFVFSGQYDEAHWLSRGFDSAFAKKINFDKSNIFDFSFAEAGVKAPNDKSFENANYTCFGIGHYAGKRISLLHAGTFYGQNESRFSNRQYQYYLRGSVPFKNGVKFAIGFHYSYNESVSNYFKADVIEVKGPPPPPGFPPPPVRYDTVYTQLHNKLFLDTYVGAFTVTKHISFFDLSVGGTFASLDTAGHLQVNAGLNFYPLRNNKLSVGTNVYYHSNNNFKNSYTAVVPSVNISPTKKSYLSMSYLMNTGINTIEQTGFIINNSPDLTTSRTSVYLSYQVLKQVHLYGIYAYETKRDAGRKFDYFYNTLIVGIKIVP